MVKFVAVPHSIKRMWFHNTEVRSVDRHERVQVVGSIDKTIGEIDLFWWWSWPNDVKDNQQHNNQPKNHNNQPIKHNNQPYFSFLCTTDIDAMHWMIGHIH